MGRLQWMWVGTFLGAAACGPPAVEDCALTWPADGAASDVAVPGALEAEVTLDHDATIDVVWISDRDGVLGKRVSSEGGRIRAASTDLSVGRHAITLEVRERGVTTCSASGVHTVGVAPMLTPTAPASGARVPANRVVDVVVEAAAEVSLTLTSDLDGELGAASGSGPLVVPVTLSPGLHTLTAHGTSPQGVPADAIWSVVSDQAPTAPTVRLDPAVPTAETPLIAVVEARGLDPEEQPVTHAFTWSRDGEVVPEITGPVVPQGTLVRGEVWSVSVVADDGAIVSEPATATVTIDNAAPRVLAVSVRPEQPTREDVVACEVTTVDADADVTTLGYVWRVQSVPLASGATLSLAPFPKGAIVTCEAIVQDGFAAQDRRTSVAVRILDAPPSLEAVTIEPPLPSPGESVTCEGGAVVDLDGDPVEVQYAWFVDGVAAGDGPTTVAPELDGAELTCVATPIASGTPGTPVQASVRVYARPAPGNVLFLFADDMGVDKMGDYAVGVNPPSTPNMDALAARGVRFDRAWSQASCSPTRATVNTGRYAWRTGIGRAVNLVDETHPLAWDEVTVPELFATSPVSYSSAVVGKWHLGTVDTGHGLNPVGHGYGTYRGNLGNLRQQVALDGGYQGYSNYEKSIDAEVFRHDVYITTDEIDDAIDLAQTLPEPWFLYVSFHAGHSPYHTPPEDLYPPPVVSSRSSTADKFDAMIEALDTEIGRLVDVVPADTTIVFLGDNGTPDGALRGPYVRGQGKLSVYEGGIRVPLVVAGPWVEAPGTTSDALVNTTDLFATFADLTGSEIPAWLEDEIDSVSIVPYLVDPTRPSLREVAVVERFQPNGFGPYDEHKRAIRDDTYKLIWDAFGPDELYEIGLNWVDGPNLLAAGAPPLSPEAQAAYDDLSARLADNRFD